MAIGLQMVAGRFVSVYSTKDWTLGIVFRARYLINCQVVVAK